jgi:DNA-binding transcriptional LysR family regulator
MNLQQLRYLVAAADAGSLSGAARRELVSQPVVSRALHSLEREYGVQLFRADGRRLGLTQAGESVAAAARRALDAVEEVARTAQRHTDTSNLPVAATPTNSKLLSFVFKSFARRYPGTALHLHRACDMGHVRRMVTEGETELGFGELIPEAVGDSLQCTPLWTAEVVVVSPDGTELPDEVPLERLAELTFALPGDGSDRRSMIDELIVGASGRPPFAALTSEERSAWITSAQNGIGSFLSYRAAATALDAVELRALAPAIEVTVGFVHRDELSHSARRLLTEAKRCEVPAGCAASV